MDKPEIVHSFNRQDTLSHVKLGDVFGKGIVLDEPICQLVPALLTTSDKAAHMVIKSPPGRNSITKYRYCVSWKE